LKKHPLKHNVIDRDKIVVPPNWDSWGKIRVLREGFDVELVSNGWSLDLDKPFPQPPINGNGHEVNGQVGQNGHTNGEVEGEGEDEDAEGSAVALYESAVQDPTLDALQIAGRRSQSSKLEVETMETQVFLAQQLKLLETYRLKNEETSREDPRRGGKKFEEDEFGNLLGRPPEPRVMEHIGPVQFNMGGIQVDADDMVQRLKVLCPFAAPATIRADQQTDHPRRTGKPMELTGLPPIPRLLPTMTSSRNPDKWTRRTCRPSSPVS